MPPPTLPTLIIEDPLYLQHLTGPFHVETPERARVVNQALMQSGLKTGQNTRTPRKATKEEILLCHTEDYWQLVQDEVKYAQTDGSTELSTGDVNICPSSFEVAIRAAGGVLTAVDAILNKEGQNAFCIVRPPGHHARKAQGKGFCLFNNIAIGARYAQKKYPFIKKVLIVDWDLHHGDGTEDIFKDDPSVFYFSTHEQGNYPGTGDTLFAGEGEGVGTILNCPIRGGEEARFEILKAFYKKLIPAMETFVPNLVLISAGFDAHFLDPLGRFNLTERDFAELTILTKEIARRYAENRVISILEGGYHLLALAQSVKAHVKVLARREEIL
ncbi:histone deacetylase [Parachlamydia sp. AcF125]|uniref:histone deacetylase family protein n=1 Tax=Parachlamydia sp. AcF125 TaxID=2795736 RepID=UPI001BC9C2D2|nr:histone deacetylase [Parachlamydia sp. AcF125]MBS4167795.1 Histone deacetylase-like amidohydrolase [Parachlamydia sp. AcF125]